MRFRYLFAILLLSAFWACKSDSSAGETGALNETNTPTENKRNPVPNPPPAAPSAIPVPPSLQDLGLKSKPGFTADHPDYKWMYNAVGAAQNRDYDALQAYVDPEKGLFFLHRPGVATSIDWMPAAEHLKRSNWHSYAAEGSGKKFAERSVFPSQAFKVKPEWMEKKSPDLPPLLVEVKGNFNYFPEQVKALTEYGFMDPDPKEKKRLDEVDELVELELLVDWVYYYFGKVNGQWRLIGLDVARCDFSA